MKVIFLTILVGIIFLGCTQGPTIQQKMAWEQIAREEKAREQKAREKDLLFKQQCLELGGILDAKHAQIGLLYCQIGQSKIQNNSAGHLALFYDKNGYDKNGFNINGFHKDTLTKYDKNGKNKNGLTQQDQIQKEYNDKILAFEKEKLELERQRLDILKQQADAADASNFNQSMESFNQSMESLSRQQQNLSNGYSKIIQQNLDNSKKKDTYYITPMGNGFYNVK